MAIVFESHLLTTVRHESYNVTETQPGKEYWSSEKEGFLGRNATQLMKRFAQCYTEN